MPNSKQIKAKIREMVEALKPDRTICPSEVARALSSDEWRDLMPAVRQCADELKDAGTLRISQKGKSIDSAVNAHGPIRLSRAPDVL